MPFGPLPDALLSVSAVLPIIVLLGGLVLLRWSAQRAAITAFCTAVVIGVVLFGLQLDGMLVALVKGLLLSLVVLLVVWAALLLFSLVDRLGAVATIGASMANATGEPPIRALLIGWGFSSFLQGIAGFGAPVASVVPLLKVAGFAPVRSIAAAMVGHSWAISFGSLGSSYLAILLVTRLPAEEVAPRMALLFTLPIIITGLSVLHLLTGTAGVRQAAPIVVVAGLIMAGAMWLLASFGAGPIASVVPALIGCSILWFVGRRRPAAERVPEGKLPFHVAFLPYYVLIVLTLLTQIGPLASVVREVTLGFDLPATTTALGYQTAAESTFPRLRILTHPAALIAGAIVVMMIVYRSRGLWPERTLRNALALTYKRSTASSTAVAFMVMMALVMADSGMARMLAEGIRVIAGPAFPLLSPFIGVLGAFMTGSNTNSNVMFGGLQVETAVALGVAPALIAAAQSVGGSLGSGISPDKAVIGASVAGVTGQESAVSRLALPYGLFAVLVVGIEVLVLALWS